MTPIEELLYAISLKIIDIESKLNTIEHVEKNIQSKLNTIEHVEKNIQSKLSIFESKFEKIEKAIGLIGLSVEKNIDYNFIDNTPLKQKLYIDNISMNKTRLGLFTSPYTVPDFHEYCRFAHYQMEGLLYFFYGKILPTTTDIKLHFSSDYITSNNSYIHNIHDLPIKTLLIDFLNKIIEPFQKTILNIPLNAILYIRNEISHRNRNGLLTMSSNNLYDQKYIDLRESKDFNKIENALNKFVDIIKAKIAAPPK